MSYQYPSLIWQSSITTGTGTLTLTGTAANLRTFSDAFGSTAVLCYNIKGDSYFEQGVGAFDAGTQTLTRDIVFKSSNADALVDLPAATHSVYATFPGEPALFDDFSGDKTFAVEECGNVQRFTGSVASTLTCPSIATCPLGFKILVFNDGTKTLTVARDGSDTIDGLTSILLLPGQAGILAFVGTNWKFRRFWRVGKVTIASAATVDLATAAGNYVVISGTASVSALGTVTAGEEFQLEFSSTATMVHNAVSLILPGGVDLPMSAGDCLRVVSEGAGNWRCVSSQRATGAAISSSGFFCQQLTSTFTIPATATTETIFEFEIVGGGGGGGYGRSNINASGGGGASGDHLKVAFKGFTPGQIVSIAIGAAGAAGTSGGSASTAGGDTTITYAGVTVAISAGGLPGTNDSAGTSPVAGGLTGTSTDIAIGSSGLILIYSTMVSGSPKRGAGQPGGYPNYANAGFYYTSGRGGSNPLGGGGQEILNGQDGKDGTGYGAAGSGGSRGVDAVNRNGGNGTAGACFVRYVL